MKELSAKKWGLYAVSLLGVLLLGMALLTIIIDPYFHYHAPFEGVNYRLYEQRYINDGISRHFEYDAVITGNSLSQNTKTTEFDELFDAHSIKLPYSGAGFKELWESLDRTLSYNPDVKQVLVIVDFDDINRYADYVRYKEYPEYLYDDNVWNDVKYLFNKDVFYHGTLYNLLMTIAGSESTTFDEYSAKEEATGADVVMQYVDHIKNVDEIVVQEFSEEEQWKVETNLTNNVKRVIDKYPDIQFYLVYSPPSIAKWCVYNNRGELVNRIKGCKMATEILLQAKNVELYSFLNDYEMICNLDLYSDTIHYVSDVNTLMLETVEAGNNRLTLENYEEHMDRAMNFYTSYNYQMLSVNKGN